MKLHLHPGSIRMTWWRRSLKHGKLLSKGCETLSDTTCSQMVFFWQVFRLFHYCYITVVMWKKWFPNKMSEISTSGLCRLCGPHGATCGADGAFSGLSSRTQPLICAALASILSRSESNMRWPGVWCNNNMKTQHCHPSDSEMTQNDRRSEPCYNYYNCYNCCNSLWSKLFGASKVGASWRGCLQATQPDIVVAYSITNVTFRILSEYASFDNWQVHNLYRVYLPLYQIISIIWMSVRIFRSLSVCLRSCTLSTSAPLCINLMNLSLCLPVDLGACLSVVYHALRLPVSYFPSLPFLLARLAFFVRVLCAYLNPYLTVYQNFSKSVKV